MSTSQDIRQLESKLEAGRRNLREDATQISGKIDETNYTAQRSKLIAMARDAGAEFIVRIPASDQ
jgi:hypothetical protein